MREGGREGGREILAKKECNKGVIKKKREKGWEEDERKSNGS